jgi:hypothetical protein
MCKVKKMSPLWGFLLSFPLWTVSCVDNKYDLDKDIRLLCMSPLPAST